MIHSMAGGIIRDIEYHDYAKVEVLEGLNTKRLFWFINDIYNLAVGDEVLVQIDGLNTMAKVVRIDKNVGADVAPISPKRAKHIIQKINKRR